MKNKDVNHYRKMIHTDAIVLLIVAILFTGINMLFMGDGYDEAVPIFLKSILLIIFLIIIICNKKENKSFVGVYSIITGSLMILTSIGDRTLFGIVYFSLGLVFVIHSILYLVKLKQTSEVVREQTVQKKSKLTYLNLGLIFFSIICFFMTLMFLEKSLKIVFILLGFISLLFVFVSSIVLMIKKYKGVLLYITFIVSLIGGFIFTILLEGSITTLIDEYKYNNSDESKIDILENLEDNLSNDVSNLSEEGFLIQPLKEHDSYVLIDKKHYEAAILLWNENDYINMVSAYDAEELEGYTCDGYVEVGIDYSRYDQCLIERDNSDMCDYYLDYYTAKSYISCSGKYSYTTEGFDENKLQESKSEDYYNLYNMKRLEYLFNNDVISFSEQKLLPQPTEVSPIIVSKTEYEDLIDKYYIPSSFEDEELEGYTCDGYVELTLNEKSEIIGQSYINCSGKYLYKTEGFDNSKLSN